MTDHEQDADVEPILEFFDSAAGPSPAADTPPAEPAQLLRSRPVVATALVALGVAGGVAVGLGIPRHSATRNPTAAAPPNQNFNPGDGSGEFPGDGFPGGGFPGFGGNGLPSIGGGNGSSSSTTSDGPSATDAAAVAKNVDPGVV